jgi:cbb3-type cytochrome oxidase maturation protein
MEILLLLIPLSVLLALAFGALFWWSVDSGQFDDLDGPAHRILADDDTSDAIPAAAPADTGHGAQPCALTSINPAPESAGNITVFRAGGPPGTRE